MGLLAITLPTIGQPNSTEDIDIVNAFTTIQTEYNANIPNILAVWQPVFSIYSYLGVVGAATYYLVQSGGGQTPNGVNNGSSPIAAPYVDPADFAISGYTTQIRLRATIYTNATAPAVTFTMGWYPVTFAGGVGNLIPTLGTVVSGTTVAIASPAALSAVTGVSSAITMPAAGAYSPGVVYSGTPAANSYQAVMVELQVRHI